MRIAADSKLTIKEGFNFTNVLQKPFVLDVKGWLDIN